MRWRKKVASTPNNRILVSEITLQEVVVTLNRCYTTFSDIIEQYFLEKIKTIGDAILKERDLIKQMTLK